MSTNRPSDPTVEYYDRHAAAFLRDTVAVDMTALYEPFLNLISPGGHILDVGCGSGRDARAFKDRGFVVTAIDASPELARLATEVVGQPVEVRRFEELEYDAAFDGVWACASLLHVPRGEVGRVVTILARSLRPGGVFYLSFKAGAGEEVRDGRRFTHFTEETLGELLDSIPMLELVYVWRTRDRRPDRRHEEWVNAVVRRRPEEGIVTGPVRQQSSS